MLKEAFEEVLNNYNFCLNKKEYSSNIADLIKIKIPSIIQDLIKLSDSYSYEGSIGCGNMAEIPWIRIYEEEISPSAQEEYYLVYLFDAEMNGFYLSLNQGVTQYEELYALSAKEKMKSITNIAKVKLNLTPHNKIQLNAKKRLGTEYEICNIYGKFYSKGNLPEDSVLIEDLRQMINLYEELKKLIGNSILNLDQNYTPQEIKKIRLINHKKTKSEISNLTSLKNKIKKYEEGLDEETSEEDYERWVKRLNEEEMQEK